MRALILSNCPFDRSNIPQVADEQIIAGPNWPDAQDIEGRWLSLRAPTGIEDLDLVLSKIPDAQWPDKIIYLRDSAAAFDCQIFDVPMVACA